jgi:Ala-tRNA(Pro) deacylase
MSIVKDYLEARGIPYEVIHHDPSSTSLAEARALGVDADVVLKAIVIDTQGRRVVAVIPASQRLDMHLVREALDDPDAHLATENELQSDFPSIELGGAPVLGGTTRRHNARRSLRARARHCRVRRRHSDGVRTGPDRRSVPE